MNSLAAGFQVAQNRPAGTVAVLAFTATIQTAITTIVICNTSGAACTARVFHDDAGGSTYDQTTAILYDLPLAAAETVLFESGVAADGVTVKAGGQIAVRSSVANAITFSIYGVTQALG